MDLTDDKSILVQVMAWCHKAERAKMVDEINSSLPSAVYIRCWTGSSLVWVVACHLFCAKPLSKPMMVSHQLHPKEQNSMKKNIRTYPFSLMKLHLKLFCVILTPFCPGKISYNITALKVIILVHGIDNHIHILNATDHQSWHPLTFASMIEFIEYQTQTKWSSSSRQLFQMLFVEWKSMNFE